MGFVFVLNSIGLGIGLAMDAFSVCIANGLKEPDMCKSRHMKMAGVYAFFQFAMPMIGWFCVKQIATAFKAFQPFIPWIALGLLLYIGGNMILEGLKKKFDKKKLDEKKGIEDKEDETKDCISDKTLIIQGIATSIDALSVGFTIVKYGPLTAFLSSLIIAIVTFVICVGGVKLGKMFGARLEKHANYLGGIILIAIGLEIFIGSFL